MKPLNPDTKDLLAAMGVDIARVVSIDAEALKLMERGVTVSLKIGRWGGKTGLKIEDLGITLSDDPIMRRRAQALLSFGSKFLLPQYRRRTLASIESRARQNLAACSIPTTFGAFLTSEGWARFQERHEELRAEYFAQRDQLLAGYDALREEMRVEYTPLAHAAWRRQNWINSDTEAPQDFLDDYLARVLAAFPTPEYIYESFRFEAVPILIQMPAIVAEELDEQTLDTALRRDVARYWHSRQQEVVDSFLTDLVASIRGQVYDSLSGALETAERHGGALPAKTLQGLETMIQTVKALDPYGDQELDVALGALRAQLDKPAKERDSGAIVQQVNDLATVMRASLALMGRAPRAARQTDGLDPEIPPPALQQVRQARDRLGLNQVPVSPVVQAALSRSAGRSL